jgi:hypothetical protein
MSHLRIVPLELKDANAFVDKLHRHHDPVVRDKFRIGAAITEGILVYLCGVVQVGRPRARALDDGLTLEVLRLCTDGTRNACSFLYGAAARVAKGLGYDKLITYILDTEDGASLRAAGWHKEADIKGHSWNCPSRPRKTTAPTCDKQRWAINLGKENQHG